MDEIDDDIPSPFVTTMKRTSQDDDIYRIGVAIADITGPAAEVNMMGYAHFGQDTSGIHFRLFARTFIVEDLHSNRVIYCNCDLGMIDQAVKTQVATTLSKKYDGLYHNDNILVTGTHTHSGPGGYLQYLLYTIVSQGFTKKTFDAIVDGIVRSVDRAHCNLKPGRIYFKHDLLLDASINRSPSAYANNSLQERSRYSHDTDKDFFLMKFVDLEGQPLGVITWFAVHPTSMNNTNRLISGDNKGYASLLLEREFNGPGSLPGKGPFVAAFSNSNLGDVSPNLDGPKCNNSGLYCDGKHSTFNGKLENCWASGPGKDQFESTKIIARRQYLKALQLFHLTSDEDIVRGPVSFIHQHIDMACFDFLSPESGQLVRTCKPAYGYSFAAGTTDGPGMFDFRQGTTLGNPFWNLVRDFISKPTKELIDCHHPKPIILATGQMNFPYPWSPTVLPTQIVRIGNVFIPAVPAEFTTMAGRRMKELIRGEVQHLLGPSKFYVTLAGLSNAYSSYVTTFEEYQIQRYEGASTIYGPHTLEAYLFQYHKLIKALLKGIAVPPGPDPPNLLKKQISIRPGVVYDMPLFKTKFGDVIQQPDEIYTPGQIVSAVFVSGHPQNNLMLGSTYLTVEQRVVSLDGATSDSWKIIATDSSLDTKFFWKRTNPILGQSVARVEWTIPEDTKPGLFRICHFGSYKTVLQSILPYTGVTKTFQVVPKMFGRSSLSSVKVISDYCIRELSTQL